MSVQTQQNPNLVVDPRLGRIAEFDTRSLNYPMRELVSTTLYPRSKVWTIRQRLNQLQTPRCVGYSIATEIGMQPYYHNVTPFLADIIYKEAQKIDYWPGEGYDGTSVLAGIKIAQQLGFFFEYRWALPPNPLNDMIMVMGYKGPVICGTNWYNDMFTPDSNGFIHPTGALVGGHAYVLSEIHWAEKYFYSPNTWGDAGFKISFDDMNYLIQQNGEVCIPVRRD